MFNVLWVHFYTWLCYINLLNIFHSLECGVPIAWSYCIVLLCMTVQYMQCSHCVWGKRMCMCVVDWIQNKCILGETFQYAAFLLSLLNFSLSPRLSLVFNSRDEWFITATRIPVRYERIIMPLPLLLLLLLLFRENMFIEHTIAHPEGWLLCLLYSFVLFSSFFWLINCIFWANQTNFH